jgi:putative transposase
MKVSVKVSGTNYETFDPPVNVDYPCRMNRVARVMVPGRRAPVLSLGLPLIGDIPDWAAWLHQPLEMEDEMYASIRKQTHIGRPCGSDTFLGRLEALTGRTLRPKPRGPKRGATYKRRKVS